MSLKDVILQLIWKFWAIYVFNIQQMNVFKIAGWVANSVDPDQTPHSAAVWQGSTLFAQACVSEYVE